MLSLHAASRDFELQNILEGYHPPTSLENPLLSLPVGQQKTPLDLGQPGDLKELHRRASRLNFLCDSYVHKKTPTEPSRLPFFDTPDTFSDQPLAWFVQQFAPEHARKREIDTILKYGPQSGRPKDLICLIQKPYRVNQYKFWQYSEKAPVSLGNEIWHDDASQLVRHFVNIRGSLLFFLNLFHEEMEMDGNNTSFHTMRLVHTLYTFFSKELGIKETGKVIQNTLTQHDNSLPPGTCAKFQVCSPVCSKDQPEKMRRTLSVTIIPERKESEVLVSFRYDPLRNSGILNLPWLEKFWSTQGCFDHSDMVTEPIVCTS